VIVDVLRSGSRGRQNTTGSGNTATGWYALYFNNSGYNNTATGIAALEGNGAWHRQYGDWRRRARQQRQGQKRTRRRGGTRSTSTRVTITRHRRLRAPRQRLGREQYRIGVEAGFYLTTGSNNIEIGNQGAAADANTIRIGTEGTQTATYIAGIFNTTVTGGCTGSGRKHRSARVRDVIGALQTRRQGYGRRQR
jgi:trimeric autotransporter adhesin